MNAATRAGRTAMTKTTRAERQATLTDEIAKRHDASFPGWADTAQKLREATAELDHERNLQALTDEIAKHHHDYDFYGGTDFGCSCGVDMNGLDPDTTYTDGPAWHARHLAEALAEAGW